ncbi:hypothetical protein H9W90_10725 [Polaribacter pectinis]|uniref:YD repeat-containing protein n=1 Tax=Polaribacter pectinis TaxID=2738844 RepID=A0A7G9L7S1_9FLAO|nr:hypothetical protein [Polaribacter pectinis]QNM84670.1 hypothetical protein H9W90_10725 [Polaribacter pectinis]
MKKFTLLLFLITAFSFDGFSQAETYNLKSQNLHKNVRKTIDHYYTYDKDSKGFVKKSVNIKRYNDDGNLIETYYLYNSQYTSGTPTKKLYNYNSDGLLIGTKDISDSQGKYSTHYVFTYDKKGNLTKRESIYTDGSKFYTVFVNDRRGRVISKKEYSKSNKLSADVSYSYKGDKKTEIRTSYSSTDGSIIGTYKTIYDDDVKVSYNSESKYGNTSTTYEYDKEGNLSKSHQKSKTNSISTYDYVYDKKDNWVKKHSKSGKYQYFYFREIYFENGDVTGSTQFDRIFINRHGNFANVAVVPLKKKEIKKTNYTNNTVNSSTFKTKKWDYDFVFIKEAVKKLTGSAEIKTTDFNNIQVGSNTNFIVKFNNNSFNLNFTVSSFKTYDDKYEYLFKNDKNATALLWIYKKKKGLKDDMLGESFYVNGFLRIEEIDQPAIGMYLK